MSSGYCNSQINENSFITLLHKVLILFPLAVHGSVSNIIKSRYLFNTVSTIYDKINLER